MKKTLGRIVLGLVAIAGLSVSLSSCLDSGNGTDPRVQLLQDVATIDSYLASNNLTAVEDVNGIRMVITKLGTGLPALLSSSVDVDYVGTLFTTGAKFDEGNAKGALQGFIDGWQIAMTTLPAGSEATLYIPPYWGYGDVAKGSIPANSILVFDIKFKKVTVTSQDLQHLASDSTAIDQYLTAKSIVATRDTAGLRYVITQLGTGPVPTWYDQVKLSYSFKLLSDDTKVIVQDSNEPTSNFYSRVIDYLHAMKIMLQKMPEGSKVTIYAPSGLAFGAAEHKDQSGSVIVIPAYSNIIIELELTDVVLP